MMQQCAGPTHPESRASEDTPFSNSNAIAANEDAETGVIHKVTEKDVIKGPLPRVNGVREKVNQEYQDATDANNEAGDCETGDGHPTNNFYNNCNNNESSPDQRRFDDDVLTNNNNLLPDQDVNQDQDVNVTVLDSRPPPPTKTIVIPGKCFIVGKTRVYKRLESLGESEAEDVEDAVVSTSGNSTDGSGGDFSADSKPSPQPDGTSPQVAQETSHDDAEGFIEMAVNQFSQQLLQFARSKVPIECTDKSTLNLTKIILVPSQSVSDYPLDMTRTPQEESSALVMVPGPILPPLLSMNGTSPPVSKDTSAYHRFKMPVTVEEPYKADLYHQPVDEGAIHSGSWQCCLKPFTSVVGNMDITYSIK